MNLDVNMIERLMKEIVGEVEEEDISSFIYSQAAVNLDTDTKQNYGIFETMDDAVEASAAAFAALTDATMANRKEYIDVIRQTILVPENLEKISWAAVEETGIGCYEHKLIKNRLAAAKTPGVEDLPTKALSGDEGLTLTEYCPFGVIGAITPTTNPTETIINNSISMIAGGNTVVFSPHPRAKNVTCDLIMMLNRALIAIGAPENMIVTVKEPSIENTNRMMEHPKVRMLVATGGPGIVYKVMSSGKKAIGAGAGNPPVVVDETADIKKAAKDIVAGSSFDNNVPCIAEKEVFAVQAVFDELKNQMLANGAYELKGSAQIDKLVKLITNDKGGPEVSFVGKSAAYILDKMGIQANTDVKVIIMEVDANHLLVNEEMMMPVLPLVRVHDVDQAIEYAHIAEHGNRHTAIIHSKNVDNISKMAKLMQTTIFVKNAPSYAGIGAGGEGHTTFTIAGPTGEGLTSARTFCRIRRCTMADALHIR